MIIAGIDEAGYGPLLGPLVVGCSAFEIAREETDGEDLPCVWKRLRKYVRKTRAKNGKTLHINDSKQVYSSGEIAELERSVLSIAAASGWASATFDDFIAHVCPHVREELGKYPWYDGASESFPFDNEAIDVRMRANALKLECGRTKTRCLYMGARVLPEREYNRMVNATRNKSSVLFSTAAVHLDHLLRTYGDRELFIFCDRQGGRSHYGHMLRLMFDDWSLEILSEKEASRSDYRLTRGSHSVCITFAEKAEAQCLPVAMASMVSKYLREGLMRRFNAWWATRVPGVTPTAGYYTDGLRFLKDIEGKRTELGISEEQLVRCK